MSAPLEQIPRSIVRTAPRDQKLDSWKEIANYLGREVRTVQRWEKADGLPVRRLLHAKRGSVYAFAAELDAWITSREPSDVAGSDGIAVVGETKATGNRGAWTAVVVCCTAFAIVAGLQWGGSRVFSRRGARNVPAADSAAGAAYLRGLYLLNLTTGEGLTKSVTEFQTVIADDPAWAAGHARLSEAHTFLSFGEDRDAELAKARASAQRAVHLDNSSAEAHEALALVDAYGDWNWAGAEAEYKTALRIDPNLATVHSNYAQLAAILGLHDVAISEARRAWQLQPLSPTMGASLAWFYYWAHRFDDAVATSRQVLQSQPGFMSAQACIVRALIAQGKFSDARAELMSQMQNKSSDVHAAGLDVTSPEQAIHNFYAWRLARLKDLQRKGMAPLFDLALTYAALGQKDSLMDCLEESYQRRQFIAMLINAEPFFDAYRNEPRMVEIARKVGLPVARAKTSAIVSSARR